MMERLTIPTTKARILVLNSVGSLGGASATLVNVVGCLVSNGFHVIVVCPAGPVQNQLRSRGAEVLTPRRPVYQFTHLAGFSKPIVHPRFLLDATRQALSLRYWTHFIAEQSPTVVHLNSVVLAPFALAAKRAGSRVSLMVQETSVKGAFGLRTWWLRRILARWVDLVIFISEFDRTAYRCHAKRTAVIPNWIDEIHMGELLPRDSARSKLGIHEGSRLILFMGGVSPIKGTLPLLEAVGLLKDLPDIVLGILGSRRNIEPRRLSRLQRLNRWMRVRLGVDYDTAIARTLQDPRIRRKVRFFGPRAEVGVFYSAAEMVVFPATRPHQARPVLEAGLAALPVIVSDFENSREFVTHGQNGLRVAPNNPRELARAIRELLSDPQRARQLGLQNRVYALSKHSSEINSRRLIESFRELAS